MGGSGVPAASEEETLLECWAIRVCLRALARVTEGACFLVVDTPRDVKPPQRFWFFWLQKNINNDAK